MTPSEAAPTLEYEQATAYRRLAARLYERFPHDRASKSFVVRLYKGQPWPHEADAPSGALATPLADLERLRAQGMISQEEYERKRKELGA